MHSSFKNFFFLNKETWQKTGSLPIYARISIDGKRPEMRIQRRWDHQRWNQNTYRVTGNSKEAQELNSFLDAVQARMFEIHKEFTLKNQPLTPPLVIQKLTSIKADKQHSQLEVFQFHNDQFEELDGVEFRMEHLVPRLEPNEHEMFKQGY